MELPAALPALAALLVSAAAALVLAVLGRLAVRAWRVYSAVSRLPGPAAQFPLGNIAMIRSKKVAFYETLVQLSKNYQPLVRLWVLHVPVVFLFHPDDVEAVMGSNKYVNTPRLFSLAAKTGMGPGLAFYRDKLWKSRRKAIASSIPLVVLQSFVTTFQEQAAKLASRFEEFADNDRVCLLGPLCGHAANMAVIETILSSDNEEVTPEDRLSYLKAMTKIGGMAIGRMQRPWLLSDWVYSLTEEGAEYEKMSSNNERFVERVVRRKRAALEAAAEQGGSPAAGAAGPQRKRLSFLDSLLASEEGGSLTNREVLHETMFMITTASGSSMDVLTFLLYTLAIRQDMQDRLHQELDDVFGGEPLRPVEYTDLPHLDFTERFIKETMRVFPVVPMFGRDIHEDVKLPSGYTLPAGCVVGTFSPALHLDERWFPNPTDFDPDRFLPERSCGRHPYSYVPFGGGLRTCVASRYAMMFMKTMLATLVRRVQFLPSGPDAPKTLSEVPLRLELVLAVKGGSRVRFRRRTQISCD